MLEYSNSMHENATKINGKQTAKCCLSYLRQLIIERIIAEKSIIQTQFNALFFLFFFKMPLLNHDINFHERFNFYQIPKTIGAESPTKKK